MTDGKDTPVTALQDLIAGGIAGSMSVFIGHPFDTYKVRLQTSIISSPGTAAFGGVNSLFRGMGPPLSTAVAVNALIFSSYGASSRIWDDYFHRRNNGTLENTRLKAFTCGAFAGACQAIIICPTDHIKCRLQVQHGIGCKDHIFKGPFDATDKILSSSGLRGLYRGFCCTMIREVPAFGLYFSAYDSVKRSVTNFLEARDKKRANGIGGSTQYNQLGDQPNHSWAASAIAGGFSGASSWALIYPIDVIKTRIQTLPIDVPIEKRRMLYVGRHIISQHGWRFLFRGLGVTLVRAVPVNGIIFPVYEFTLIQLRKTGFTSEDNIILGTNTS